MKGDCYNSLFAFLRKILILLSFIRNLQKKPFNETTKGLIRQIPYATNEEQTYDLIKQIKDTNDNGIEGIF